jgi:hypothetical protein
MGWFIGCNYYYRKHYHAKKVVAAVYIAFEENRTKISAVNQVFWDSIKTRRRKQLLKYIY